MKTIKLIKEPLTNNYYFQNKEYYFLITKQGKEGYSVDAYKWINNGMHTQSIDFISEILKLSEIKNCIFYFLLNISAKQAYNKIFNIENK